MASDINKNIANKLIKNKKYFSVGFQWYFDRYLGFFWQKRLFSALFFLVCIAIFFLFKMNLGILIDSKIPVPVVTHINHYDEIAFIKKLKSRYTVNPNILVANYLIEKYVTIRESYSYNDLDFQKKFLFNNSTSFLYLDYEQHINVSNPTSPLLMYGKDESLITDVKSIQIIKDDSGLPTKAEVVFDLYKRSPGKNKMLIRSYNANVEFYMNDIYAIKKQNTSNFTFSVLRYSVTKK
jgi:type IV secretory pathway component VirB8